MSQALTSTYNSYDQPRSYIPPHKRLRPSDVLVRAATSELLRERGSIAGKYGAVQNVIASRYASCPATDFYTRAAVNPAASTTATWAAELVGQSVVDYTANDIRQSGFAQLAQRTLMIPMEPGVASVKIPSRSSPLTLMATWIGEGNAKPVLAGSLVTTTLAASKIAGISVYSEEMLERSSIELLVRDTLAHDISALLDTSLFDAAAATSVRPASLFNGATSITASAITPANEAMIADLKALGAAVTTGNPDASVTFVCNPAQAVRIKILAPSYTGLIVSGYMPAGSVGAIDVSGVAMTIATPEFQITNDATLHMSDAPLMLATGVQGSGIVASPMASLFQMDLVGLRCVLYAGWVKRRAAATALATSVTW